MPGRSKKNPPEERPLNQRMLAFVAHYAGNASEAARLAGYSTSNGGHRRLASRLMKDPRIMAAIKDKQQFAIQEMGQALGQDFVVTIQQALRELAKLAFYDPRKFYNEDGSLKTVPQMDAESAAAVTGVDVRQLYADGENIGNLVKVRYADKGQNIERLIKLADQFGKLEGKAKPGGDGPNVYRALRTKTVERVTESEILEYQRG